MAGMRTEHHVNLTLRTLVLALALVVAAYMAPLIATFVGLMMLALILAASLVPAIELCVRRLGLKREMAVTLVFAAMIVTASVLALVLVPTVIDQVRTLATNLPQYLHSLQGTLLWLHDRAELVAVRFHAPVPPMPDVKAVTDAVSGNASLWVGSSLGVAGKAVGFMGMGALVLMLAFFALLEGPALRASLLALVPPPRRALLDAQINPITAKLGGYVQGMAIGIAGLAVFQVLVLTALGLPLALALGLLSALLAVVPLVGGVLGVIPPALVGLTVSWQVSVWALVLGYLGHFIVANFVLPIVFARSVKLSPLMVTVALLVGAEALGIFGALIAVPVAAALQVLVQNLYIDVMERAHASQERDALKFVDAPLPKLTTDQSS
ncbi:MAG: hypothetical protein JWM80_5859 [Cyanobacteria bacterium RYN_339]|nr:hypothetical protein [Cyanobacteria bacterium RYN_339]